MITVPQPLQRLPWTAIFLVAALGLVGFATLYSTAGGSLEPWALRQGMIFAVVFLAAIGVSYMPVSFIKAMTPVAYVGVLGLLVAVELYGFVGKGAQRWINLGFMQLQPSELMKPVIVMMLARFYELLPTGDIHKWRAIWPAALLVGLPAGLTLIQPDLGTALAIILGGLVVVNRNVTVVLLGCEHLFRAAERPMQGEGRVEGGAEALRAQGLAGEARGNEGLLGRVVGVVATCARQERLVEADRAHDDDVDAVGLVRGGEVARDVGAQIRWVLAHASRYSGDQRAAKA